jgi:hypothetical protein
LRTNRGNRSESPRASSIRPMAPLWIGLTVISAPMEPSQVLTSMPHVLDHSLHDITFDFPDFTRLEPYYTRASELVLPAIVEFRHIGSRYLPSGRWSTT